MLNYTIHHLQTIGATMFVPFMLRDLHNFCNFIC